MTAISLADSNQIGIYQKFNGNVTQKKHGCYIESNIFLEHKNVSSKKWKQILFKYVHVYKWTHK